VRVVAGRASGSRAVVLVLVALLASAWSGRACKARSCLQCRHAGVADLRRENSVGHGHLMGFTLGWLMHLRC